MPVASASPVLATDTVASVPATLLFLEKVKSIVFCAIAPIVRNAAAIESRNFFILLNFKNKNQIDFANILNSEEITPPNKLKSVKRAKVAKGYLGLLKAIKENINLL